VIFPTLYRGQSFLERADTMTGARPWLTKATAARADQRLVSRITEARAHASSPSLT
jgi:hypothetical protein